MQPSVTLLSPRDIGGRLTWSGSEEKEAQSLELQEGMLIVDDFVGLGS
jgi:hypothetical protein